MTSPQASSQAGPHQEVHKYAFLKHCSFEGAREISHEFVCLFKLLLSASLYLFHKSTHDELVVIVVA